MRRYPNRYLVAVHFKPTEESFFFYELGNSHGTFNNNGVVCSAQAAATSSRQRAKFCTKIRQNS